MRNESFPERQLLRNVYGCFPVGVTVLTTSDASGQLWGMTASSFCPISMDPPLISVALMESTPSHDAFAHSNEFAVSILSQTQFELARKFATPSPYKFAGVHLVESSHRSPILDGAVAWLVCRPERIVTVGDHSLLVGEVIECAVAEAQPLAYQSGGFFALQRHPHGREEEEAQLREHGMVAFLVESDARLALALGEDGEWTLPMGKLVAAPTIEESLLETARNVLDLDVNVDFLYSMVNLSDNVTCSIYRARLRHDDGRPGRVEWFQADDLPWTQFTNSALVAATERYLKERVSDQFGVFVGLGEDRLAVIPAPDPSARRA